MDPLGRLQPMQAIVCHRPFRAEPGGLEGRCALPANSNTGPAGGEPNRNAAGAGHMPEVFSFSQISSAGTPPPVSGEDGCPHGGGSQGAVSSNEGSCAGSGPMSLAH